MSLKKPKTIGEKLFQLRTLNNLSQKDLAEKIGISAVIINYYENDKRKLSPKVVNKFACFYQIDVKELTELIIRKE